MKLKVFFILTGVIILHAVILTGVCLTGGCNSTPVLGPRPYIPAPEKQSDFIVDKDEDIEMPKVTIKNQPVSPALTEAPVFKLDSPPQGIVYTVQKNDSFWKIARKHGVTMQSLAAYNNMSLNKVLRVGQKLNIPPGGYVAKNIEPVRKSPKKPRKAPRVKVSPQPRPADGTYSVKSGDSFWKIARKYNLKTKTLLDANNMTGKETLQIGQKLIIPDGKNNAAAPISAAPETAPKADTSITSILDTVDSPEEVNTQIKEADIKVEAPNKEVDKLIEDTSLDMSAGSDRAVQVIKDIKVEDFAKQYKITPALLKQLNDDYPSDGVFKAGSVVIVRSAE